MALKLKPNYEKTLTRAANCCYQMKQYNKCIEYCNRILDQQANNNVILDLKEKCLVEAKLKARDERKKEVLMMKKEKKEDILLNEIKKRGYKIEGNFSPFVIQYSSLAFYFLMTTKNNIYLKVFNFLL